MSIGVLRASAVASILLGIQFAETGCTHADVDERVGTQSSAVVGAWTTTATSLGSPRSEFSANGSAISLKNGDVLFAGGVTTGGTAASAVDMFTGQAFTPKAPLPTARGYGGTIGLDDGSALYAGGGSVTIGPVTTAQSIVDRWTPTMQSWQIVGMLQAARHRPSATRLSDGRILLAGGSASGNGIELGSAELFNQTTNAITSTTGTFTPVRTGIIAGLLADGKVALIGGQNTPGAALTLLTFDPTTQLFTNGPSPNTPRFAHAGARLPDGRILYCGGCTAPQLCQGASLSTCEIFDGTSVTNTGSMAQPRGLFSMITLATNRVLAVGGASANATIPASAEIYDPTTGMWTSTGAPATARFETGISLLPDGKVLLAGGRFGGVGTGSTWISSGEIYDPGTPVVCSVPQIDGTTNTLADGTACVGGTCQTGVCVAANDAGADAADASSDSGSDAGALDAALDATSDASSSDASDAGAEVSSSDATADATETSTPDATPDASMDASDATSEAASDAKPDVLPLHDASDDGPGPAKDAASDTGSQNVPDVVTSDAGAADSAATPSPPEDSGCQCQTAGPRSASTSSPMAALMFGFVTLCVQRVRSRSHSVTSRSR